MSAVLLMLITSLSPILSVSGQTAPTDSVYINEILVSLMLVYVAEQILALASLGFLRNPDGAGFPGSRNLSQYSSAANSELIMGTGIHLGVLLSLLMVVFFYVLLFRHSLGFKIKLLGNSPKASGFSGDNPKKLIFLCLTFLVTNCLLKIIKKYI